MKEIQLTKGKVALVDDEDYDLINQCKWHATCIGNTAYAYRGIGPRNNVIQFTMHQVLLGRSLHGLEIDHIDGNGLNNQRSNLRMVTHRQNIQNRHHKKSSRFAGVRFRKNRNFPWESAIQVNGNIKYLGSFATEDAAHERYQQAELCINTELPIPPTISRIAETKTSRYRGVHFDKTSKKWIVQIRIDGTQRKIGRFTSEDAANKAYVNAAKNVSA